MFSPSTGKYGPEKTSYLDTFYAVLDSDYENDDSLESERSFSVIFNTFVNQWCVKKDKNVIAFMFHAFPKIPEM